MIDAHTDRRRQRQYPKAKTGVEQDCSNFTKAGSRFAPSQWETSLQSNAVSHWLGANLESALLHCWYIWVIGILHWDNEIIQSPWLLWLTLQLSLFDALQGDVQHQGNVGPELRKLLFTENKQHASMT